MTPTARLGDMHVCPLPGHGSSPIVSASPDVQINFLDAARVGDVCGGGAVITTGFSSIIVDHRPLAHLGSPTSHGGTIVTGSPDTFGGFQFGGGATQSIIKKRGTDLFTARFIHAKTSHSSRPQFQIIPPPRWRS